MIIRHLARSKCLALLPFKSPLLFLNFVTCQNLLSASKKLIDMDSLELDKLCQNVLSDYERPKKQIDRIKQNKNKKKQEKSLPKNSLEKEKVNTIIKTDLPDINVDQLESKQQIIKFLYNYVSDAKIGILKGDIHSQFVFNLHKQLSKKAQKQLLSQMTVTQLKKIIHSITDLKYYRLPKNGIKNSQKEDFENLYERQLFLQSASHQLSSDKADNVLDSLVRIGKIHLAGAFQSYLTEWFPPLCTAIKEEQSRCKDTQNLQGSRKIYANDFLKLSADRLTSVCLSELLKQIVTIMFKDFNKERLNADVLDEQEKEDEELHQFDNFKTINFNKLCMSISKWVGIQNEYEKMEEKFKEVMKIFDHIFAKKVQQVDNINKKILNFKILLTNKQQNTQNLTEEEIKAQIHRLEEDEQRIKKEYDSKAGQVRKIYKQNFVAAENRKRHLQDLATKMIRDTRMKLQMPAQTQFQIGSVLLYLMKQIIKISNRSGYRIPLLTVQHKYNKRFNQIKYVKLLKVNDHFINVLMPIIEKQGNLFLHLERSIPTIISPMPWMQYEIGGYYLNPSKVMKFSNCNIQERLVKYADLSRLYDVLNSLSRIQWKINKKVLNVIEELWIEGGDVGQIPKRYSELISTYLVKCKLEKRPNILKQLNKKIQLIRDEHSLRADFNLKINLARSFSLVDKFYFPHHIDFRGRVYPIPPHLNHIGNDLSRGLLTFAQGKRLGAGGLKWLKIHCANLMGKDKAPINEKLEFIQANLGTVHDIAENPLKNRDWLNYQDCWQTLAAIFELDEALKQPVPQQFISTLHIHQDGSCNGLQHYAALGRDSEGASQVNLAPTQRPGDVYTHVAKMVIKMVQNDIADVNSKHHELAKKIQGNIKRKTIKQTVMTSVYGVTFIGAREQIYKQIRDQKFLSNQNEEYDASLYLAGYTLKAISNLFSSAHLIKKWLIECAKLVTNEGNPMGWITPMGLPVVQPYRKQSTTDVVNTVIRNLKLIRQSDNLPVDKVRQRSAFPPNFVHSLDSTHMMYTAQQCIKKGIVFAAVHDSYWTHAATVDQMNQILRKQFIKLHSEPLLQNLKESLEMRYPHIEFPKIPERGDFDLNRINQSLYFFS